MAPGHISRDYPAFSDSKTEAVPRRIHNKIAFKKNSPSFFGRVSLATQFPRGGGLERNGSHTTITTMTSMLCNLSLEPVPGTVITVVGGLKYPSSVQPDKFILQPMGSMMGTIFEGEAIQKMLEKKMYRSHTARGLLRAAGSSVRRRCPALRSIN